MEYVDREAESGVLRETPEEAARAIASALEFLRDEAAAIGRRDVGIIIGLARARMLACCPAAAKAPEQH